MTKKDHIIVRPKQEDINEILAWLKEEKENDINKQGFYNNKDIIIDSFESGNTIIFKHENENIGLLVWSEYSGILIDIDIFVIHPSYRGKGYGELYYKASLEYFRKKGFKVIKLFCQPETSESFWKKMGLIKYPDCGYFEHELTYYTPITYTASTTAYAVDTDKIELWDVEPNHAEEKQPRWIWYVKFDGNKLLLPIIHPCNCDWNLRWSRNGTVLKEEKVKYFTDKYLELYKSGFLYIEDLEA